MITILSILIIASGCTDPKDNNQLFPNIDARSFADAHFTEQLYRNHEWFLAINVEYGNSGRYEGNRET